MASPFSPTSEVVILNAPTLDDAGNLDTFFAKRTGTLASGKQRKPRYTVEVRSQPLLFDLDEYMLGAKPAEAIRGIVADQIRHISEQASAATLAQRAKAATQFAAGLPSAQKRYSGGRIGPMAPNQSNRLFNDSGRMAEGVFVRQNPTDKTFTINLPANRDFGQGDVAMFERFRSLVPGINPEWLASNRTFNNAVSESISDMIAKAENATQAKLKMLAMQRRRALVAAGRALLSVA